jgi:cleavage and polyadenylation specificity factor subunit 4
MLVSLQTVCTYWLKGLCMKGEDCGFLHQLDPQRMPVCRTLLKFGECKDPECPFKHNLEEVKVSHILRTHTWSAYPNMW